MELLEGIGETPAPGGAWQSPPPDIAAPVGLGRGPFQGRPGATPQAPGAPRGATPAGPPAASAAGDPPTPTTATDSEGSGGRGTGSGKGGLPQRRAGESLPPGLRGDAEVSPQRSASAAPVSREESRSLLSSYQSRLQAGRKAAEDQVARTPPTTAADEGSAPSDGEAGPDDAR